MFFVILYHLNTHTMGKSKDLNRIKVCWRGIIIPTNSLLIATALTPSSPTSACQILSTSLNMLETIYKVWNADNTEFVRIIDENHSR